MPREKSVTSKLRKTVTEEPPQALPPNENLERYADEAYGDTEIPAQQRSDATKMEDKKHARAGHPRAGRRTR
jgi:hypothetical protein